MKYKYNYSPHSGRIRRCNGTIVENLCNNTGTWHPSCLNVEEFNVSFMVPLKYKEVYKYFGKGYKKSNFIKRK